MTMSLAYNENAVERSGGFSAGQARVRSVRAGFSLIEMLVVMAILTILITLVISPLVTTFNYTNRARRSVEVQDAARYAMEVMSRETADAMNVVVGDGDYEPFLFYPSGTPGQGTPVVVRGIGYMNAYDNDGKLWELPNALIDLVLPHDTLGYYNTGVQQPLIPQYETVNGAQHPVIVRYFVGLTHPDRSNPPRWRNINVTRGGGAPNMYTLYRVEFDPYDPRFSNWALPDPNGGTTPDGKDIWLLNPDFFYDATVVQGKSQAQWWRKKSVAIMPTDSMDLVDFVRSDPKKDYNASTNPYLEARSLVVFNPLISAGDSAGAVGDNREPATYKTEFGHWCGLQNDGTVPYDQYTPMPGARYLPRIVIYRQDRDPDTDAITLVSMFDTAKANTGDDDDPAKQNRVLSWNSLKGTVEFSLPAPLYDSEQGSQVINSMYEPLSNSPGFTPPPGAYITQGTEVVTVEEENGNGVVYSRASSATKDVYDVPDDIALQNGAPKQLPPPRTYMVTDSGKVIVGYPYPSVYNPVQSQPVPPGHRVTISYYYQNNSPEDLVKVDYQTRELVNIGLTSRMYDPSTRKSISTTMANRVRIRNIQR